MLELKDGMDVSRLRFRGESVSKILSVNRSRHLDTMWTFPYEVEYENEKGIYKLIVDEFGWYNGETPDELDIIERT